jgi:hypothetical protein
MGASKAVSVARKSSGGGGIRVALGWRYRTVRWRVLSAQELVRGRLSFVRHRDDLQDRRLPAAFTGRRIEPDGHGRSLIRIATRTATL